MPTHAPARSLVASIGALAVLVAMASTAHAQFDTRHWIPSMWGATPNNHCLFLSTPEAVPVAVEVLDGAGDVVWSGTITNAAPIGLRLRGGACGTWSTDRNGPSTITNVQTNDADLNIVNTEGLQIVADGRIFANVRHRQTNQGASLTGKGRQGLGREFRVGFMRDMLTATTIRRFFFSVMATTDETTVTIDGFAPGVTLLGHPSAGDPATATPITVTLEAGESLMLGHSGYADFTADLNDINGIRVVADKPVAMVSGNWLGGAYNPGWQDIGIDQPLPVDMSATEYVLQKGNGPATGVGSESESPMVLAVAPNTNVFVGGDPVPVNAAPLQPGDYVFLDGRWGPDGNMLVTTSARALMYQTLSGGGTFGATQGLNVIPPLGGTEVFSIDNMPQVELVGRVTLGVITKVGAAVSVNGIPVPAAAALVVVGTPDYVTYRLDAFPTGGALTGTLWVDSTETMAVSLANLQEPIGAAAYFAGFPPALVDLDFDNTPDGVDNCPETANPDQRDTDGDGAGDACDGCPLDDNKLDAGVCGCGTADVDANMNGTLDCEEVDLCPTDPAKDQPGVCGCGFADTDTDADETPDCNDFCPEDKDKTVPGGCGCGVPDADFDFDGVLDCHDNCRRAVNPDQLDGDGDDVGDACDPCPDVAGGFPPCEVGVGQSDAGGETGRDAGGTAADVGGEDAGGTGMEGDASVPSEDTGSGGDGGSGNGNGDGSAGADSGPTNDSAAGADDFDPDGSAGSGDVPSLDADTGGGTDGAGPGPGADDAGFGDGAAGVPVGTTAVSVEGGGCTCQSGSDDLPGSGLVVALCLLGLLTRRRRAHSRRIEV